MNSELQTTEEQGQDQGTSMIEVISRAASDPSVDVTKMSALLDMQERIIDKQAEQSFNRDFVAMQSEGLSIIKTTENKQTKSMYAKLQEVQKYLIPITAQHGFAITFGTEASDMERHVRVTADLIHRDGHSKHYQYDSPFDDKGIAGKTNKTDTHAKASAITYGQRYLTTLIFNITLLDDDDGNAANTLRMSAEQIAEIEALLERSGRDRAKFLEWNNHARSVEYITSDRYDICVATLKKAIQANKEADT